MSRVRMFMAVMVGVLAFSAVVSSMANANWMVGGTNLTETAALATTAKVDEKGKLTTGALGITISCNAETLKGTNPTINALTEMGDAGSLEFTECTSAKPCPLSAGMGEKITTLPLLVDVTLDGTLAVKGSFLSTNTSKIFATVAFEGAECSLKGMTLPITGFVNFLAPEGQDERTAQLVKVLDESTLLLGKNKANLLGAILLQTANGSTWSFL